MLKTARNSTDSVLMWTAVVCETVQGSGWFDGLGSAVVGGVVAALVAVGVTRAQLNHDRRMRRADAADQAALLVATTIGDLQASRRSGFTSSELQVIWGHYRALIRALKAVEEAAPGDARLREWAARFANQLTGEIANGAGRKGTQLSTLNWAIGMAEQVLPRLRDPKASLEDRNTPAYTRPSE